LKTALKKWIFRVLRKDPEAVVLSFLSGPEDLAGKMSAQVRELVPDRRHFFVSPEAGSTLALWWRLRKQFRHYRIGLAPVLMTGETRYKTLRRAAFLLAPGRILAFNSRLERHHLRLSTAVASLLFLRGVPADRIYLRPKLWFWRRERSAVPSTFRTWEGRACAPGRGRVAVLTPYFPWPLSHGGAVRIFSLIQEMAREFDVFLLAFGESETADAVTPMLALCAQVVIVDKPVYREPRWSTLLPPEVGEFRSPAMREVLARLRQEQGVRVVQVEYTFLAPYGGSILVEHDVTFDLYRQIWERERTLGAWWDFARWRRFEKKAARRFPRVAVMSGKDQALLGTGNTVVIPNGVDLERFRPEPEVPGMRVLFIGSFRHFPNIVAFRFFFEEVWPGLRQRFPGLSATVVAGPEPLGFWKEHTGQMDLPLHEGVNLLGFVADVRPLYVETNLVLVPTLVSAGTNVKVLEALAMERAVLSTTSGCGGLELEHGVTAWIADGAAAFCEGAAHLLENPEVRQRIAAAGRSHAMRRFDWKSIGALQRDLVRSLLGPPAEIRRARESDLPALTAIQSTAPEAAQWNAQDYLRFDSHIAIHQGTLAGFLVSRQIVEGEREILNVAVHPDFRRRGIATMLIRADLQRWPGDHFLEVRESNTQARTLYRALGFREVGVRPGYYDSPPEPGIVMRFFS